MNYQDETKSVVEQFMQQNKLFTALDISTEVKKQLPHVTHRDVRSVVRGMFATDIEPQGWARTPIVVTLNDGTTAEALLYHDLMDSFDLDSKYDKQKRGVKPAVSTVLNGAITNQFGTVKHYVNDKLHNDNGPAVLWTDGSKEWRVNGIIHRVDGPAYEGSNGAKEWRINGKFHREDGPAVVYDSGYKVWYLDGVNMLETDWRKAMIKKNIKNPILTFKNLVNSTNFFNNISIRG